jgi:hypothetical protein
MRGLAEQCGWKEFGWKYTVWIDLIGEAIKKWDFWIEVWKGRE